VVIPERKDHLEELGVDRNTTLMLSSHPHQGESQGGGGTEWIYLGQDRDRNTVIWVT
jgi:hypothetical protein